MRAIWATETPAVSRSRMRNFRSAVARRIAVRRGGGGGGGRFGGAGGLAGLGHGAGREREGHEGMWPGFEPQLWHRDVNKGFATIPKTMPLILQIMDDLSGKGKPVSSTYLGLWCDTWDNSMVNVTKPQEMAHAAGFSGQRAIYTWGARVHLLHDLKFINVKAGNSGPISHVLILNSSQDHPVHHHQNTPGMNEANFNALLSRALDIGANDMISGAELWGARGEACCGTGRVYRREIVARTYGGGH